MRRAEGVVEALGALGEAGKAAFLAQRADAVAPAGEDLVRIALMPDVEDQPVVRRVENLVDGNGQFDDAEPGAQMPAGLRYRIDHLVTHFAGKLRQIAVFELAQVCGIADLVQQGRRGQGCHGARASCRCRLFGVSLAL